MNIRPAITTDIALLQAIGKQTFYETFADTNTPEDMEQYLTTSFATSKVQQELSNPDSLFFFAEEEITEEQFCEAVYFYDLYCEVGEDLVCTFDVDTDPDYFLGHLVNIRLDDNYRLHLETISG